MTEQVKISDKFFVYQPDGEGCGDFVAFNGAYGESILDEAECVKMLNGFNNTCAKQAEQIKMLRDCISEIRDGTLLLSEIDAMCDKVIELNNEYENYIKRTRSIR